MRDVVVVGAGLAGLRAAEHLRRVGFDGRLTMVGDEPFGPYNRPPLSKQMLSGEMDPADCFIHHDLDAGLTFGVRAVGLDRQRREVLLSDGRLLHYDGLIIATGSHARTIPAFESTPRVFTLRSLDDAQRLRAALESSRRALVIGAGFIGCEVVASLTQRGVGVTMIDLADQVMTPLGSMLARRAETLHRTHGVDLRLGVGVVDLVGTSHVRGAHLTDGTTVAADLVLVALGARPNVAWLAGSGLDVNLSQGLRCDRHCGALGDARIVGAGDVAEFETIDGRRLRLEHWSNAPDMAEVAAANLLRPLADREPYRPTPTMWTDQYGVRFQTVGEVRQATEWIVVDEDEDEDERAGTLVVEGLRGGEVVAAVGMNASRKLLRYQARLAMRVAAEAAGNVSV